MSDLSPLIFKPVPHLSLLLAFWREVFYHIAFPRILGASMHDIFNMLLAVFDRAALMLICLFFLIRLRLFRELLHKSAHTPRELLAVTAIFSMFALFSTWSGVPVEGSLVNVRIIAVMSGGILFGPWVGAIVGVIAGVHRYLIDIDGVTAIPCLSPALSPGYFPGLLIAKFRKPSAGRWGFWPGCCAKR